ncbi:ornithine carbamoyltransferase [Sedimentibacter sp. zth1]|uniref:ornithine carbamoyltransferase n=1 Tax=Sedimentibacter sp. zth1 TaxID=2816908 RepID=UPI001A935235|nr:ornithine carbamoyltransferase [Sedimentibacter sp. zth1]QSX05416.1 ornithine carbamoyltransferase [Sedimentibacter sp. zth1]
MAVNLKGRSFLTLLDFTPHEIRYLLDLSHDLKAKKRAGVHEQMLKNKNVVLLFEKTSTRTRCAFEVACHDEGASVTFLDSSSSQMGKKESLEDTAKVLGRFFDGIEYRGFDQDVVELLAKHSGVPVFNGLTDEYHPTQMLADMMTIEEKFGKLKGINFTYMGDARNNMGNSLMIACAKLGLNFTACAPKELWPTDELVAKCKKIASESDCTITLTEDVKEGTTNADVIYTDIWVSMGEPPEVWETRIKLLSKYQVNSDAMKNAKKDAIFMHCLPSFHDTNTKVGEDIAKKFGINEMEVTDEVFRCKQSVVFDEAENRMHSIKAVLVSMMS